MLSSYLFQGGTWTQRVYAQWAIRLKEGWSGYVVETPASPSKIIWALEPRFLVVAKGRNWAPGMRCVQSTQFRRILEKFVQCSENTNKLLLRDPDISKQASKWFSRRGLVKQHILLSVVATVTVS